jgi:hypothetical protein
MEAEAMHPLEELGREDLEQLWAKAKQQERDA